MEELSSHWAGFHEILYLQWLTQEFCSREGGSTNSVEDRENGDLGAVAP